MTGAPAGGPGPLDPDRVALVILAGGPGTRLWPLSTRQRPKPFAAFAGAPRTLLQTAWDDAPPFVARDRVFVNVARGFEPLALAQLPDLDPANLIVAPEERNTLPICGYATAWVEGRVPGATVLVVASDARIGGAAAYHDALLDCAGAAQAGPYLVALGVRPTTASTQFGYMALGARAPFGRAVHHGLGYVEKPGPEAAERLLAEGCHDWNTGAFAWDAGVFFEACRRHAPAHHAVFDRMRGGAAERMGPADRARLFAALPAHDVDRGLMERLRPDAGAGAPRLLLVRGQFDWDDVGSLASLGRHLPTDADGNGVCGDVAAVGARGCTLLCEAPYGLRVDGLADALVVVSEGGDVVVCAVGEAHRVPAAAPAPAGEPAGGVRLVDAPRAAVTSDGQGTVAVVGVADCAVDVRGRRVSVRQRAAPGAGG